MIGRVQGEFDIIYDNASEWTGPVASSYGTFEEWIRIQLVALLANSSIGNLPASRAGVFITEVCLED